VEAVLALELAADRPFQLDPPVIDRVFRLAALDRGNPGRLDIGRGIKIGFALAERDDIAPGFL